MGVLNRLKARAGRAVAKFLPPPAPAWQQPGNHWGRPRGVVADVPDNVGIDFSRQPDPAWQAALDAECPPELGMGRLVVVWDAGDRWQWIHRWVIYYLQPWHLLHDDDRAKLLGPHPRTDAKLVTYEAVVDGVLQYRQYVKGPFNSGPWRDRRRLDHEVFRQQKAAGYLGKPHRFWIVQGPNGGQPFQLTEPEERLWQLQGRTHLAPNACDTFGVPLPGAEYAPFDARVIPALRRYDLWRFANGLKRPEIADRAMWTLRAHLDRVHAHELEANKIIWQKWEDKAEEIAPELQFAARQDGLHRLRHDRPGFKPRDIDYDEVRERFLHETQTETAL